MILFSHGLMSCLAVYLYIRYVNCQSPGPDWPECALASQGSYGGWEFSQLSYQPPFSRGSDSLDAILQIDMQNAVDGSRTVCDLRAHSTTGSLDIVLDSQHGGCETGWSEKYESFTNHTQKAPSALVKFDVMTMVLSINQTWTCRSQGQLLTFTGVASGSINITCSEGREGERTRCEAVGLHDLLGPPVFLGPAAVAPQDGGAGAGTPTSPTELPSSPECRSLLHRWQILDMKFVPPGPQPKSENYWPTSIRAELRNLDDGSRTLCELGTDNAPNNEDGVLLYNDGEPLHVVPENSNRIQGCLTGWWHDKLPTEQNPATQEWRWSEPANVTFHTKTHVLSISQTYRCARSGVVSVVSGSAVQELRMDCQESGNQYYPLLCEPRDALFSNDSAPVVLGG